LSFEAEGAGCLAFEPLIGSCRQVVNLPFDFPAAIARLYQWAMTSDSVPLADDLAQSRQTKVFNFLKELNELRNPVIPDMSAYPDVLTIDAHNSRRARNVLEPWLKPGWQVLEMDPEVL
jgi:hypothetical protein